MMYTALLYRKVFNRRRASIYFSNFGARYYSSKNSAKSRFCALRVLPFKTRLYLRRTSIKEFTVVQMYDMIFHWIP